MPYKVFVYGTLKPGECNYQTYCAPKVIEAQRAIALGLLFSLPLGYPAMTAGELPVQGFLLSFSDPAVLNRLDWLEGYDPHKPAAENEYNRQQIQTYSLDSPHPPISSPQPLDWAWVYLMTLEQVNRLGGVLLTNSCWNG